jgi:hypothetical protein
MTRCGYGDTPETCCDVYRRSQTRRFNPIVICDQDLVFFHVQSLLLLIMCGWAISHPHLGAFLWAAGLPADRRTATGGEPDPSRKAKAAAHTRTPVATPQTTQNAGRRPWERATPATARRLGPGATWAAMVPSRAEMKTVSICTSDYPLGFPATGLTRVCRASTATVGRPPSRWRRTRCGQTWVCRA